MIEPSSSKEHEANSSSSFSFFWFIKTKLSILPPASFWVIRCIGSYWREEDLDLVQITMILGEKKDQEEEDQE